jgi:hypothetical protein
MFIVERRNSDEIYRNKRQLVTLWALSGRAGCHAGTFDAQCAVGRFDTECPCRNSSLDTECPCGNSRWNEYASPRHAVSRKSTG